MIKADILESDVNQWFADNAEFGVCFLSRVQMLENEIRVFYFEFEKELFLDLPAYKCKDNWEAFKTFKEYYLNANYQLLTMGA